MPASPSPWSERSEAATLLNLVAGLLLPDAGRVEVRGVEVSTLEDAARRSFRVRRLGLVFQEFELLEHLDVMDNVLLPCRISPATVLDTSVRERAARLVSERGLADKQRRNVRRLSQGVGALLVFRPKGGWKLGAGASAPSTSDLACA